MSDREKMWANLNIEITPSLASWLDEMAERPAPTDPLTKLVLQRLKEVIDDARAEQASPKPVTD